MEALLPAWSLLSLWERAGVRAAIAPQSCAFCMFFSRNKKLRPSPGPLLPQRLPLGASSELQVAQLRLSSVSCPSSPVLSPVLCPLFPVPRPLTPAVHSFMSHKFLSAARITRNPFATNALRPFTPRGDYSVYAPYSQTPRANAQTAEPAAATALASLALATSTSTFTRLTTPALHHPIAPSPAVH
jgi:hypothetical protein